MAQRILTLILLLAGLFDAPGRSNFVPADQAFAFDFQQNQHDLNLTWQVKDGYYLYRKQISIIPAQAEIAAVKLPAGVWHEDEFYGKSEIYRNTLTIPVTVNQETSGAEAWQRIPLSTPNPENGRYLRAYRTEVLSASLR